MEFEKLSNDQHLLLEYLYERGDNYTIHNALTGDIPQPSWETLKHLSESGLIVMHDWGNNKCRYCINAKGKTYIEAYRAAQADEDYRKLHDAETLNIAKKGNELSAASNKTAKIALLLSCISTVAALASVVLSVIALLIN